MNTSRRFLSLRFATRIVCAVAAVLSTLAVAVSPFGPRLNAAEPPPPRRGDRLLADYFETETRSVEILGLANAETVRSADAWPAKRAQLREQLLEMLGLAPLPEKTDLHATITSRAENDGVVVEQLHFQSRPGLYVTGNLYRSAADGPRRPAILYVCGHGGVKKDGVSYGNKVHYQHHGAWFARQGYVCLIIDSLQLGEIEALHHGTYNHNMWWWLSRGYTPAGVEAWNCIRALDYLQSRPDVDGEKLGVTGRSGGGAYSWWIAALDERIGCAVPVAGITDLRNHVVDGCVEGHCDCMYFVNTYQWDYWQVAALVAPRPLLISNTDRDGIFPLDGVVRLHRSARTIYELLGAKEKYALNITAGGHQDTQELQIHAMRWFDQHLRGEPRLIDEAARPRFTPEQLRVFRDLPSDQVNTRIQETFVPLASPALPRDEEDWKPMRDGWLATLREKTFRGWNQSEMPLDLREAFREEKDGVVLRAYDFVSEQPFVLRLYVAHRAGIEKAPDLTVLNAMDTPRWRDFLATYSPAFGERLTKELAAGETLPEPDAAVWESTRKMFTAFPWAMAYVAPRGVGPTAWTTDVKKQTQIKRRFYLLGQSLEGMQVYDLRRAIQTLRGTPGLQGVPVWLQGYGEMGVQALYASLFEPAVKRIDLHQPPRSHDDGPALLNVRRFFDIPQAVAMAAERSQVVIYQADETGWDYPSSTLQRLGRDAKQLQLRRPPEKR